MYTNITCYLFCILHSAERMSAAVCVRHRLPLYGRSDCDCGAVANVKSARVIARSH